MTGCEGPLDSGGLARLEGRPDDGRVRVDPRAADDEVDLVVRGQRGRVAVSPHRGGEAKVGRCRLRRWS